MPAVSRVAVAGGGVAGTAVAILLAEAGLDVELFETKADLSPLGSGITLQGNALRVLRSLGVWSQVKAAGYGFDQLGLRAPGPEATVRAVVPDLRTGGPDLPATLGMFRPDLARILFDRAEQVGVHLRTGVGVDTFTQDDTGVDVTATDGSTRRVDLLIGADGLHSRIRTAIGIDVEPRFTGMAIWRAFVKRPASVTYTELYHGGPCYIAGYCPTGEDSIYAYLVEDAIDRGRLSDEESVEVMRELSLGYGGPWNEIRDELGSASRVHWTRFTEHLVPAPWNRGRVVLIGDAAHSCPPTLAQGAAQGLEDALVLAERLLAHDVLEQSVWDEFHERRLPRAGEVVRASVQLGDWMLERKPNPNTPSLMHGISALVSRPA